MLTLLAGATSLLYTHYFCALLLPALALFHLFYVRRGRRWWQAVFLLGLAALLALPQFPVLLDGIQFNQVKERLHERALAYPEVIALFLRYLSNGLLVLQRPFSSLFTYALPLSLLFFGWHNRHRQQPPAAATYLLLTSVLTLLLLLGGNEWIKVLDQPRVRYLSALWPPVMLLIGMASLQSSRALLRATSILLLVLLVTIPGVSDFLFKGELSRPFRPRNQYAASLAVAAEGSTNGLLFIDKNILDNRTYEFYTGAYAERREVLDPEMSSDYLLERAQERDLVWLLLRKSKETTLNLHTHLDRFRQQGWFHCRSMQTEQVTLELLLAPFQANVLDPARMQFESDIALFAPAGPELRDGLLRFQAGISSADDTLLSRYSLAVHVVNPHTGERAIQGDTGVGPGSFVPLCREIDVSALPPGDYEVRVALYDWQTGERLSARDLETDEVSDMHMLHHFRIG